MPRLPDFTSLGQTPAPQTPLQRAQVDVRPLEFTVRQGPGEAMIRGGHEITSAGLGLQNHIDTLFAEDATNKLQMIATHLRDSPEEGFSNIKGADAIVPNFYKNYSERFQSAARGIADTLPNDASKKLFLGRSEIIGHQYNSHLLSHISQQTSAFADNTEKATVALEVSNASNAKSDAEFDTSLVRIRGIIDSRGARLHQPSAQTELDKFKAMDSAWTERIRVLMNTDPLAAQKMYEKNKDKIGPDNKIVIENHLNPLIRLAQSENIAKSLINGASAQEIIKAIDTGGEDALNNVIQSIVTEGKTGKQTKGDLGQLLKDGAQVAERLRPGDFQLKTAVDQHIKGYINTLAAVQENLANAAHERLIAASLGPEGKNKPLVLSDLLTTQQLKNDWSSITPKQREGFYGLLEQNGREAMRLPMRNDPKTFFSAFQRIHLPDDDPRKIRSPEQLVELVATDKKPGLNRENYDWLKKELDLSITRRGFSRDLLATTNTAHRMLTRSIVGSIQPDVAEEAAHSFTMDLYQKVDEYQKAGKDPRTLLTPGSPDYVLKPERVQSFMPTGVQAVSTEADKTKSGQYEIGKPYTFKQGKFKFKGGDITNPDSWEKVK